MIALQINCFDVLSDTTFKTGALLQEQVTNAISCSPCLIVLRHVDALSHSSSTADGQEGLFYYLVPPFCIYTPCIVGLSIFQTVQQSVDEANKSEEQQCILLGIVEEGKIPEGISFSNEIEIKVGTNCCILCFLTSII